LVLPGAARVAQPGGHLVALVPAGLEARQPFLQGSQGRLAARSSLPVFAPGLGEAREVVARVQGGARLPEEVEDRRGLAGSFMRRQLDPGGQVLDLGKQRVDRSLLYPAGVALRPGEIEVLPGAGERHIEEAPLLVGVQFALDLLDGRLVLLAVGKRRPLRVDMRVVQQRRWDDRQAGFLPAEVARSEE